MPASPPHRGKGRHESAVGPGSSLSAGESAFLQNMRWEIIIHVFDLKVWSRGVPNFRLCLRLYLNQ